MNLMEDIKRDVIKTGTTREFLTSYDWDFEFIKIPSIFANDEAIKNDILNKTFRLRSNGLVVPEEPINNPISVFIRGHRFSQPGDIPAYGQFTIAYQDFADVTIQNFFLKLIYSMADPISKKIVANPTKFFFDCNIYRLTPTREVAKIWKCRDCQLVGDNVEESMSSDRQPIGSGSVSFLCDLYTIEYPSSNDITNSGVTNSSSYNFTGSKI